MAANLIIIFLLLAYILGIFIPVHLLIKAKRCGLEIGLLDILGSRFRGAPPHQLLKLAIKAHSNNVKVTFIELESHYLCGGSIEKVVSAIIYSKRKRLLVDFRTLSAIDLSGRDLFEVVELCTEPTIFKFSYNFYTKDEVEHEIEVGVTTVLNINKLLGNFATESFLTKKIDDFFFKELQNVNSIENFDKVIDEIRIKVSDDSFLSGSAFEITGIDFDMK